MPRAPIAGNVVINDQPARPFDDIFKVFSEEVLAHIPEGQPIKASRNNMYKEIWKYPIGTQVVNYLTFKDNESSVFELRMIRSRNT